MVRTGLARTLVATLILVGMSSISTNTVFAGSEKTLNWDGKGSQNGMPTNIVCNTNADPYLVFILAGTGILSPVISTNTGISKELMTKMKSGSNSSSFKYTYTSTSYINIESLQVTATYQSQSTQPTLTLGYGCLGPSDLVGYWDFNNSSNIGAPTIKGIQLLTQGDAQYTSEGKRSGGLLLDGSGDFLKPDSATLFPELPTGNSAYTIAAWIKPNQIVNSNFNGIVGWGNYGFSLTCNALRLAGSALLNYWWGNDVSGGTVTAGNFHHVAATYDGSTRVLYVDGLEVSRNTPNSSNNSIFANFAIGFTAPSYSEYFQGVIDDVAIYKKALTSSEIISLSLIGPS